MVVLIYHRSHQTVFWLLDNGWLFPFTSKGHCVKHEKFVSLKKKTTIYKFLIINSKLLIVLAHFMNNAVWDGCRSVGYKWIGWIGLGWSLEQLTLLIKNQHEKPVEIKKMGSSNAVFHVKVNCVYKMHLFSAFPFINHLPQQ